MSKVLHLRISDEAIYTCMKVLQDSGINTTSLAMATIVRRYIEGSTENYRNQVSLAIPEELPAIIEQLLDDTPIPIVMPAINATPENVNEYDPNKLENIKRAMLNAQEDSTKPDIELHDVVEEEKPLPPPPWLAAGVQEFEAIQSIAPKDILVEKAKDNEILQRAIQCVYSDSPTHEWGSKHLVDLVKKIIPTITLYFPNQEEN